MLIESPRIKVPPTNEHFEWLVKSRSRNQVSAYNLRKIMTEHEAKIRHDMPNDSIHDDLLGICFSLWRAVFLTDLSVGTEHVFADKLKFMDELIANNTITYAQDKGSQEWSFLYYMENARYRLADLNRARKDILSDTEYRDATGSTDKGWWEHHQNALEVAIENFERLVSQ